MSQAELCPNPILPTRLARLPLYYGWVNLVIASVAMSATLPGRTHGLGLIAKPLIEDARLGLSQTKFDVLNFFAILLGSALCLPTGWLIDRIGTRTVLTVVALTLGASVIGMSWAANALVLFLTLTLVRGLGQGALSVVSMAMVGKWFTRRLGVAMGIFTVLLAFGFIATVLGTGWAVTALGWRQAWSGVGLCLVLGLAPLGAVLSRSTPESVGLAVERAPATGPSKSHLGLPVREALSCPAFWAFTLAAALFNLVWSAVTLHNESILEEHRFGHETFLIVMAVLTASGLPANLLGGWLAGRWPLGRLLLIAMLIFAAALIAFPFIDTTRGVLAYAAALGVSGGIVTVIFFAVYGYAFGRAHLGAIQAVVQIVTVLASALGPLLLTLCKEHYDSYAPMFFISAAFAVVLGLCAWLTKLPRSVPVESSFGA